MAESRRRLLRSTICAPSSCSIASPAVAVPLSACARMPSTASSAPGIFRSASIARTRSRRPPAIGFIARPRRRSGVPASPPRRRSAAAAPAPVRSPGAGRAGPPTARARPARRARSGPRAFPRGAVPTHVGRALQPPRRLLVQILVVDERASVEEVLPEVADRPLHLALGLRPVRPARARHEAPVRREAQELRVQHQFPAADAVVRQHHRAHLVEQQFRRNPAEARERALQPVDQHRHRLPPVEAQPQQARVAQHYHQSVAPPPRQRERPEVHLPLTARRRLEPHRRLDRLPRSHLAHVVPHAAVAARYPAARTSSNRRCADSFGNSPRRASMIPLYGSSRCGPRGRDAYRVRPEDRSRSSWPVSIHSWIVLRLTPNRLDNSAFDTPCSR